MKKITNVFHYLAAYFAADTRALREEASRAARDWMVSQGKGSPHFTDSYQIQVSAYARSYANARCHLLASQAVGATRA